jgi:hypothetical protein
MATHGSEEVQVDVDGEILSLPTFVDTKLSFATLARSIPGSVGLKYKNESGGYSTLLVDPSEEKFFFPPPSGWTGKIFHAIYSNIPPALASNDKSLVGPGSKRPKLDESLSQDKITSYWDQYKHFIFYLQLDEGMKAAASLLDSHRLVLCMHEIPELQDIRYNLLKICEKQDVLLSMFKGDEEKKKEILKEYEEEIESQEMLMKVESKKRVLKFFDHDDNSFLTKSEFYNWRQDICVVVSLKVLCEKEIHTDLSLDRGTEYIMLGFEPPDYSYTVINGIIAGTVKRQYLFGIPGAFPGISGGPVIQKFKNGKGSLIGICSGAEPSNYGMNSSIGELLEALCDAQTSVPYVFILPVALILPFVKTSPSRSNKVCYTKFVLTP